MLQHLADGRVDLMMGRGNTGPVYPWFGKDIRDGIALAVENYALLHRLWREDVVDWEGKFRTPLQGFTVDPAPARRRRRRSSGTARSARPEIAEQAAYYGDGFFAQQHLLAEGAHPAADRALPAALRALRPRPRRPGDRRPRRPGLHAQELPGRGPRVPARTSTTRRSTATARRSRSSRAQTPLTVGSPQQVIERTLGFREYVGDYQRQLFLMDHAGLPLRPCSSSSTSSARRSCRCCAASSRRTPGRTCRTRRPTPRLQAERDAARPLRAATAGRGAARRAPKLVRRMSRRLVVVSAGLSQPSSTRLLADRLDRGCRWASLGSAARRRGHGGRAARARPRHRQQPADRLRRARPAGARWTPVAAADGLIAVTPIFTASYSGLFKSFFDVLDTGRADRHARADRPRPAAPRGTRSPSTTRCARCSATCAQSSCRPAVYAASSDWGHGDEAEALVRRIDRAGRAGGRGGHVDPCGRGGRVRKRRALRADDRPLGLLRRADQDISEPKYLSRRRTIFTVPDGGEHASISAKEP